MPRARTIFALLGGAGALAGCTSILGSFDQATIGDANAQDGAVSDVLGPPSDTGAGGKDGATTGDADDGATPPLVCTLPLVACGSGASAACVNLDTSPDNCGACGHSCGGGQCLQRRCLPSIVYQGTTVGPIAQDLADVFFESNEDPSFKLLACPKAGCVGAPRQVTIMPFSINAIHVPAPQTLAFLSAPQNGSGTERPAVFSCATTGCPSPPVSFVADGLNGIQARLRSASGALYGVTGGTGLFSTTCTTGACATPASFFGPLTRGVHGFAPTQALVYFIDAASRGGAISKCAAGDTACAPVILVPGDASLVESLSVFNAKLFWLAPGRAGFNEGKLLSCDLPACTTVAPQATAIDSPTGLFVDASGAYWFTAGNKLQHCAANGCVGGQQDLVLTLDTPHDVIADDTFVYWAEKTKISRIAK